MLSTLRAACLSLPFLLGAAPAQAEDWTPAEVTSRSSDAICARISSRLGWQRLQIGHFRDPRLMIFEQEGWSVDDARYARVGVAGYSGAAARALEPYAQYKYQPNRPFGALLMRKSTNPGGIYSYNVDTVYGVIGRMDTVDFRINDTGQGDNGGVIEFCIRDS